MQKLNDMSLLEFVEEYALTTQYHANYIVSEDDLSDRFDDMLRETNFFDTYREDDEPAISEAFNTYADSLVSEGLLHSEQVNKYDYVGEWS